MKKKILVSIACLFLFVASFVVTNAVSFNSGCDPTGCQLAGCAGCAQAGNGPVTCIGCKGGGGEEPMGN